MLIGPILKISSAPEGFTLYDSKDALAAEGLYYASWTAGQSSPYTNEDGETVDLYPAQITLICAERKNEQSAQEDIDAWKSASTDNYDISEVRSETVGGQEYEFITYTMKNPASPWRGGVSAFGVHENAAICAELTYQDTFTGNAYGRLTELLSSFLYSK